MPWLLLLKSPWTWGAVAFAAISGYAAVQHIGWQATKAEYVTFQATVAKEAADAKVAAARQEALQATNAQEAIDALSTRNAALSRAYASLRARPGSSGVPKVPGTTAVAIAIAGSPGQPDPAAGCLEALEWGDRELSKYAELWRLQQANAAKQP